MARLENRVQLIGNLGTKPELKTLDSGKQVAKLKLATNGQYVNDKGEKVEDTQWHTLVAWGKTAEIADRYLDKGSRVAVEGRLKYNTYEDKEGNKRYFTEVVVGQLLLLDGKS